MPGRSETMTHPEMIQLLHRRFSDLRFPLGIDWQDIEAILISQPAKLETITRMELSGGEPGIIGTTPRTRELIVCDCSPESPKGRRSLCYDEAALQSRKENRPLGSAVGMAGEMGAELMDEDEYGLLQQCGEFDLKTSSWLKTPGDVRAKGGALFGDRRFGRVFTYHNGAESYYASRGFRVQVSLGKVTHLMSGRLSDCILKNPEDSELIVALSVDLVEALEEGRDRFRQALLNASGPPCQSDDLGNLLDDPTARGLIAALGVGLCWQGDESGFTIKNLRYSRIILAHEDSEPGRERLAAMVRILHLLFQPLLAQGLVWVPGRAPGEGADQPVVEERILNLQARQLIRMVGADP